MRNRYSTRFFLKQAFTSLWRNGVMSFASVAVLTSCLIVLSAFALLVANINTNLDKIAKLNVIMVYCDYDIEENKVADIKKDIEALSNVESCKYISKDEALEEMKAESDKDKDLYSDITAENNPLCESFEVTYESGEQTAVNELEKSLRDISGVRKLNSVYDTAQTIEGFKNGIMLIFSWFLVILLIVSIFVIVNTIKLSVFARRHEITVMRYVGATNTFITVPFIAEGVIIGVASSMVAYGLTMFLYDYISTNTMKGVSFISMISTGDIAIFLALGCLGVGILTGIVGSVMSLRKYLKS